MNRALQYIEIDIPVCANTYGVAPCTASLGVTGAVKCFNTVKTCQAPATLIKTTATLRFAVSAEYLPHEIEAIPSVASISFTPAIISLGTDLGQRATLEVTFTDHPDSDTGVAGDKYLSTRGYDPFSQGTFWGKFRARQPYLQNLPLRWINGLVGQNLADMETRHFVITSFDGPTPAGQFTIEAADVLKLADGDQAQAPRMSAGFLLADITAGVTSFTLSPSGIGASYPASGVLNLGGNELVTFARTADVCAISRAQLNTVAATHKAGDRAQLVLQYTGADAADILYHLLVTYSPVPASYIDLAAWRAETAAFLGNVYTANICEPTDVNTLVSELIEQAALAIWDDDLAQALRLQVLRAVVTNAFTFTPDNTLLGTLTTKEQPEQRLSRVQTYFGQINPLLPLSNTDNYRSTSLMINAAAEVAYGAPAIKTILSRWIPPAGRTVADRLGAVLLGRFSDPPRHVGYEVMRYAGTDAVRGAGYQVQSPFVQDPTGAPASIPIQVTQLNPAADRFIVDAEEMLFTAPSVDLTSRVIVFDANNYNVNLRDAHDSIFPAPTSGVTVTFTINAGVIIGSHSTSLPAVDAGSWPAGVTVNVKLLGRIQGRGGDGAYGDVISPVNGNAGGTALYTRQAINLDDATGAIWGGGGGGGSANGSVGLGGGGGAGQEAGLGGAAVNSAGSNGSATAGGLGGTFAGGVHGGAGGGPGLAGAAGNPATHGNGGAAGLAIDGISHVTITAGGGDIRGAQVN